MSEVRNERNELTISAMFGGGEDITGRQVEAFGDVWTIEGKDCCGNWKAVRYDSRSDGKYKVGVSLPSQILPPGHPYNPITLLPNTEVGRCQPTDQQNTSG